MDDKHLPLLLGILEYLDTQNLQEDNINEKDVEIFNGNNWNKLKNKRLTQCILNNLRSK